MSAMSEFEALVEAEVARLRWEYRLDVNELLWGSAYGPWLPPDVQGLEVTIIGADDPGGAWTAGPET